MRRKIDPEDYKGTYYDRIIEGDIIVISDDIPDPAGRFPLKDGLFESLWVLSNETGLGMMVDIRRFPLSQEEIERYNREDINPYEIPREGELLILHPRSEYYLSEDMIIIGYLTSDKVCRIKNKDNISFLRS